MKKFNVNSILFLFAVVFIAAGIRGDFCTRLKKNTEDMLSALKCFSMEDVLRARTAIDKSSMEALSYHDKLMDLDSLRKNLLGTRVVIKDGNFIIRYDSGGLGGKVSRLRDDEINEVIACIQELKNVSEENGARFLFCAAPHKTVYEQFPPNVESFEKDNYDRFLAGLKTSGIPALDFRDTFKENNVPAQDIFYYTDHHWRTRSGLLVSSAICKELSARYGFEYDAFYTDLDNYSVTLYPDWFLGSFGKKTGRFFTWKSPDDFELITPKFRTDMREEQPFKKEVREGTFEETVLFMENMEKDYYHKNSYATYSGGDFRLQIMKNKLNPDGKKILVVRDSFACAVAPFLALHTSELHLCDVRSFKYFVGDKMNMGDYIRELRPDYVLVLYNSIVSMQYSDGKYNFF